MQIQIVTSDQAQAMNLAKQILSQLEEVHHCVVQDLDGHFILDFGGEVWEAGTAFGGKEGIVLHEEVYNRGTSYERHEYRCDYWCPDCRSWQKRHFGCDCEDYRQNADWVREVLIGLTEVPWSWEVHALIEKGVASHRAGFYTLHYLDDAEMSFGRVCVEIDPPSTWQAPGWTTKRLRSLIS